MIEVVSPGKKDRERAVASFADKIAETLEAGIHVMMVDPFRPGTFNLNGSFLEGSSGEEVRHGPAPSTLIVASLSTTNNLKWLRRSRVRPSV